MSENNDRLFWIDYETTGVDLADPYVIPIEVGVVITDTQLNELQFYTDLIHYPQLRNCRSWGEYAKEAEEAFQFHKISIAVCQDCGRTPREVARALATAAKNYKEPDSRMIMISDNIQFEWQLTKMLMHDGAINEWPWHYCGWDTSILELVPGLGFKDPENTKHRGLSDVQGLLEACRMVSLGGSE